MRDPHGWLPVLLDGFVGSFLGVVASVAVAIAVVRRTEHSDRDRARLERAHEAARGLAEAVNELLPGFGRLVGHEDQTSMREREQVALRWTMACLLHAPELDRDAPGLIAALQHCNRVVYAFPRHINEHPKDWLDAAQHLADAVRYAGTVIAEWRSGRDFAGPAPELPHWADPADG